MGQDAGLGPVTAGERIEAMDVLRGSALLGILLMNIEAMVGPLFAGITGTDPSLTGADRVADALVYILVQGKFYPLFSLLFGMGFAVMMARAGQSARPSFVPLYLRRTLGLLAIGLAHALLVWSGDVLLSYALMSIPLLLFFRRTPLSRLPRWGVTLYLVPIGLMLAFGALSAMAGLDPNATAEMQKATDAQTAQMAAQIDAQRAAQGGASYWAAVAQRARDTAMMLGFLPFFGLHVLGMFVLGTWFVRSGAIARPAEFAPLYVRLRLVALPVGLALMLLSWTIDPQMAHGAPGLRTSVAFALHGVASLLMCLGYLAWIVHGLHSARWAPKLRRLAPAGRMALTNYLVQSVVCTLVFSGYGLGYFEQLPRAWQVPFALALFALQVAWSRAWLARFRYGPMEWLWRAFTYGRLPATGPGSSALA
ncbi:MAG TPA: DUF418 domain-containing protein [Lysobacter sp.]